jgi:hypothetical protein
VTGDALERRYRRLLAWYPPEHRRRFSDEMVGVLLAAAPDGARRPELAGTIDLVRGGLQARFRSGMRWLGGADWPGSLAVCSVAVPVILAAYFAARWLRVVIVGIQSGYGYANLVSVQMESALIVATLLAPPLLALRWRRIASAVAVTLAGWYVVIIFASVPNYLSTLGITGLSQWPWLAYGEGVSGSIALLLGAAGLAWSPGPRRGIQILGVKSWLLLIMPAFALGLAQTYLWAEPLWLVTVIVIAALVVVAIGLVLTIAGPAARGLVLLLAAPAYPCAVWIIGYSRYYTNHVSGFPVKTLFAPTILFVGLAAVFIWRGSRRSGVSRASGGVT